MRKRLNSWLRSFSAWLNPLPSPVDNLRSENRVLREIAANGISQPNEGDRRHMSMLADLAEAVQMSGSGPWQAGPAAIQSSKQFLSEVAQKFHLRESADGAVGATGDINLILQTIGWRRELLGSWMEFSRWGIQQIILICRLYYVKHPWFRRLSDVSAAYVFARGVEVTTNDDTANEVWADFVRRNAKVFGQIALVESEKRKDYDGNLYWVFFPDTLHSGLVDSRLIDATEIQEIVTNPDDSDTEWLFRRIWEQKTFDFGTGSSSTVHAECWYPAMGYQPAVKPERIGSWPVMWDCPVLHRKCGHVGKWLMGCPRGYPALDWMREGTHYLTACASLMQSLMQIGLVWTTKGGQQAITGIKNQVGTTVGPQTPVWDTNPPAVSGSSVVTGTGTDVKAFNLTGAGGDPSYVHEFKLMVCSVWGVPETFLADVSTGNLATATSLDRPTETVFLEKQEAWREDLTTIAEYVLGVSAGASSGKLRESALACPARLMILESRRVKDNSTMGWHYEAFGPKGKRESKDPIQVQVNFPAIREGDTPALVKAVVEAMTLDNKGGQIIGIDEKIGVIKLLELLGIPDPAKVAEEMYPSTGPDAYDPDRTKEILPDPIKKAQLPPGGEPQIGTDGEPTNPAPPERKDVEEASRIALEQLSRKRPTYRCSQ